MMKYVMLSGIVFSVLMVPHTARAQEDTLCPSAEEMRDKTPDALMGVQLDIDRLTLCIERARLLKQLDDVIAARKKMLDKMNGEFGDGGGAIPVLPAGSLPAVKGIDAGGSNATVNMPVGAAFDQAASAAPIESSDWKIRKIWGQGAGIRAQLSDNTGILVNAVKGDPLPDGAVVETVSVKGVVISRNGKVSDLSWEQVTDPNASKTSP